MRRKRIGSGLAILVVAGALALYWWDTVIDLDARQRAYDRIRPGMTLAQVEWVMGGPGEPQFVLTSGQPEHWPRGSPGSRYSWDDAYTAVTVRFSSTQTGDGCVQSISRGSKDRPELGWLWFRRVALLLLAAQGIRLVRRGLRTPKPIRASLATADDDPVGSWANT